MLSGSVMLVSTQPGYRLASLVLLGLTVRCNTTRNREVQPDCPASLLYFVPEVPGTHAHFAQ